MNSQAKAVRNNLSMNLRVIKLNTGGLSHEDTLIQPPHGGNCLNWLLGHLLQNRESAFALMGIAKPWVEDAYTRYARESEPLTDAAEAVALEQLLVDFDRSQELLEAWFAEADDASLTHMPEGARRNIGLQLNFLVWHEAYHAGQIELLRHIAGKHESLI